jgi:hypothetical protein
MKKKHIAEKTRLAVTATTLTLLCGCAVLTDSQVREVKTFAQASADYKDLSGDLVQSYGVLQRNHKLLETAHFEFGVKGADGVPDATKANAAWENIKKAHELEQSADAAAKRMKAALEVLGAYSDILTALVSEKFNDDLQKSSGKLAASLDGAITEYNKAFPKSAPVKAVGTAVGKAVYIAGAVYTRHRQIEKLREVVALADPLVADIMKNVEDTAANNLLESLRNYEENYLGMQMKEMAIRQHYLDLGSLRLVYEDLARVRSGIAMAGHIAAAARTYREAHKDLVEKTKERMTLKAAIDTVKALKEEVDAANKIKEKTK